LAGMASTVAVPPELEVDSRTAAEIPSTTRTRTGMNTSHWLVPLALLAAASVWTLWRTGIGVQATSVWFEQVALTWPHAAMEERHAYRLRSPVGYLAYRALPFRGVNVFTALHAVAILGAYLGLAGWFLRSLGWHRGLIATTVLVLSPITAVLLVWIGMYDAFTMVGWVALLWSLRAGWPVQVVAGLYLGVQNAEQAVVGVLLLWLLRPLVARSEISFRPLAVLAGCFSGKALLEFYLRSEGALPGSRLSWVTDWSVLEVLLSSSADMLPVIVWSGLCGLWFFVPLLQRPAWTPQLRARVGAAAALWAMVALIAMDHSRLLAITSVPVVVFAVREIVSRRLWSVDILVRTPAWWVLVLAPPSIVFMNDVLAMGWRGLPWGIPFM
jgi:hypothetical protein